MRAETKRQNAAGESKRQAGQTDIQKQLTLPREGVAGFGLRPLSQIMFCQEDRDNPLQCQPNN